MTSDVDTVLSEALRRRGRRVTAQRLAIARSLRELDRHATADVVFAAVSERLPGVSLPTVYATLELLEEVGLVRRLATGTGSVVYDPRTAEHHHLVCRVCGAIADVEASVDTRPLTSAARSAGFAPDDAQVVVSGVCAACAGG